MYRLFLSVCLLLCATHAQTQFSTAVKDSVLAQLKYPSGQYNMTLGMNMEDYSTTPRDELYTLNKTELLNRLKGNYRDGLVYRALFSKAYYEEKNISEANRYLGEAFRNFEQWMFEAPDDPTPLDHMISMTLYSGTYGAAQQVLDTALRRFPNNPTLMMHAIYYYQYAQPDYNKSQEYINKLLAVDPASERAIMFQVTLYQGLFLKAMQQKQPATGFPEIPLLNEQLKKKPVKPVYQHLEHYRRLSAIYFSGMNSYLATGTDDPYLFNYFSLSKEEEKTLKQAEKWMLEQVENNGKNTATALSTLGIISCIKKEYQQAYDYFRRSHELGKIPNAYESMILTLVFTEKYPEVAALLQEKIAKEQKVSDYSSLLRVYHRYMKDTEKEKQWLKQLEMLNTTDPEKNTLLAVGYLLNGQKEQYTPLLAKLNDHSLLHLQAKITAAVLNDDAATAKEYIQKAEAVSPGDKDIARIRLFTGL